MSNDQFNPNSTDAMLATIIANQKAEGEKAETFREEIKEQFATLAARVSVLEKFKFKLMGAVAFGTFCGGSIIDWIKSHK